ncbi:helicase associated domain-containing protein [Streptomyces sp. NPDC040724]|uniref:helicase associated domain-containing protein n=1 Tax=Streptomyces sp. NPDC040724 TaxID=3155612 RepID=UPI0033DDFFB3
MKKGTTGPQDGGKEPRQSGSGAFERGVSALVQCKAHTGSLAGPRAHVERLEDETEVGPGVWLANQQQRRDRLDQAQFAALAELSVDWAQQNQQPGNHP